MAGRYVLHSTSAAGFQWELETAGGEVILSSPPHASKASAEKAIYTCRTNSGAEARYERHTSQDSQAYFVLTNGNGETVGTSRMYGSVAERNDGIAMCKENGLSASTHGESSK